MSEIDFETLRGRVSWFLFFGRGGGGGGGGLKKNFILIGF